MKKNLFSAALLLGMTSMFCGSAQAETVDELIQKQKEAVSSVSSTSTTVAIHADVAIDLAGAALTAAADGEIELDVLPEGPDLRLEGSIDVLSPLLAQENTYDFKFFIKTDESGSPDVYVYYANAVTGESYWDHDSAKGVDISALVHLADSVGPESLSALGIDFSLTSETQEQDGKDCYQLSTVLDVTTFSNLLSKLSELYGQDLTSDESVALALEFLDGLKFSLSYDIDAQTYLPSSMHLDLNDSDLSAIETLISSYLTSFMSSEEPLTVSITLNDVSIDAVNTYNAVTEIIVPEEGLYADASPDVIPDETEAELVSFLDTVADAAQ